MKLLHPHWIQKSQCQFSYILFLQVGYWLFCNLPVETDHLTKNIRRKHALKESILNLFDTLTVLEAPTFMNIGSDFSLVFVGSRGLQHWIKSYLV